MERKIEEQLLAWKNKTDDRLPLIVNGARQVGKTYILRKFGEEQFKNVVYINLETNLTIASYFNDNIAPERLLRYLEASTGERIIPEETLIIFDEIQSSERALTALKYFCEETPEYHIAAAGSLLGVAINRQHYSFPVGKVETLTLYPLDFEEYLGARSQKLLSEEIRRAYEKMEPLPDALHQKAIELYREYLLIGGMPACINAFLKSGSFLDVPLVQNEILDNYIADMAKYASNTDSVKIRACYNSIPAQLAKDNKKFQYKVVQKGGSAALFGASIEWLNLAGVVLKCQRINQAIEPIAVYTDLSAFKLYMGDVGLLTMKSGLSQQTVLSGEGNTFMGAVTENYVAQQLAAKGYDLYYWESSSTAELDFVLQKGNQIVGVEVKKGEHVRSRSLSVFVDSYKPAYSVRLSLKNFGEKDGLKSVPLYAAFYAGWPKAWAAFRMAKEVWAEDNADDAKDKHQNEMVFPIGAPNDGFAKYFIGQSYLAPLSTQQVGIYNVTFEPGCRNNWHIHHAKNGGGQILVCVAGRGYYQEWGKPAQELRPGDVVNISVGVKHWHGAAPDSWFSHLAVEVPGDETSNEWLESVDNKEKAGRSSP